MNILGLLLCVVILTVLLLLHSYFKHGFRITFNFFLFALIVAISKETGTFFGPLAKELSIGPPFFFPKQGIPFAVYFLTVVLGWVFTFYLSWALAENIIGKLNYFRNKIFPTLLFSGVAVASISYAAEVVGTNMGWWKWSFHDNRFSIILIEGAHFFALEVWFFFATHFLMGFFLIEYSGFSKREWKGAFFTIIFIQPYLRIFSNWINIEQTLLVLLIVILSFICNLSFRGPDFPGKTAVYVNRILDCIPAFSALVVLFISAFLCIFYIKKINLLIALLPVLMLIILSIKRINSLFIIFLLLILSVFVRYKMVPAIVSVSIFFIFSVVNKYKQAIKHNSEYAKT